MSKEIKLLECTLRDGGFRIDDADKNGETVPHFDAEMIHEMGRCVCAAGVDIVELGAIENPELDKRAFSIYPSMEEISKTIPENRSENQIFAAHYRDPDIPTESIPSWRPGLCEAVRVIIRYSEMKKSLDFCRRIVEKGYKLFIQPALTMRYKPEEIQLLLDTANEINAYAVYFVDTYGYMQADDVRDLFYRYDKCLQPSIRIGFHAHNNMDLAFSNVQTFLALETDRNRIVDACTLGMGQGAGNMQTEILADYLNRRYGRNFDYDSVLQACELIEKCRGGVRNDWGYSLINFLPALHKVAFKYAMALRYNYGLSYVEIDHILRNFPDELRHRYTPKNMAEVLQKFGYQDRGEG